MRILVVGESCVDIFQYGTISRICPEAPCPVFVNTYKKESEGMAANVVANLKAIDSTLEIDFITNISKPYKIRFVDEKSNQMVMRNDINDNIGEKLDCSKIPDKNYSALIVSDYDKGFLSHANLVQLSWWENCVKFLDTKKPIDDFALGYDFVKINDIELDNAITLPSNLIVTKGAKGAKYDGHIYPTEQPSILHDVAGAGDSFLAGLVYEYLKSNDIHSAICYANKIAGIVVGKKGVATI